MTQKLRNCLRRLIIHEEGVEQVKKWMKEGRQDVNGRHESEILVAIRKQVYNHFA